LIVSVIIVGVLAIAVVGGTAYFFYRHVNASFTPPEDADTEFAQARARFAGQKPLIEIRKDDEPILHREGATRREASGPQLVSLRVLAYDNHARKLVRVTIPFWLLRLKSGGGHIDFNGNRMDLDDLRLSVEDLERYGPTLIVDHRSDDGKRVLVWSQ
jgi:hypothetical protein